jgi:hypothetical protein
MTPAAEEFNKLMTEVLDTYEKNGDKWPEDMDAMVVARKFGEVSNLANQEKDLNVWTAAAMLEDTWVCFARARQQHRELLRWRGSR